MKQGPPICVSSSSPSTAAGIIKVGVVCFQVAEELTAKDVIKAHARDELGIDMDDLSNPIQAAAASAFAFCIGAGLPLLAGAFIGNYVTRLLVIIAVSTVGLLSFGITGEHLGYGREVSCVNQAKPGYCCYSGLADYCYLPKQARPAGSRQLRNSQVLSLEVQTSSGAASGWSLAGACCA